MKTPGNDSGFEVVPEGEVLRETDLYLSSSGNWQPCPCPGIVNQGDTFYRVKSVDNSDTD
jgi:hypothetical protein